MTTKDWQSEVDAAARECAIKREQMEYRDKGFDAVYGFKAGTSWAREKLEERIAELERTEKVYLMNREWIEAAKEREAKLVEALEKIAGVDLFTYRDVVERFKGAYEHELISVIWTDIGVARAALQAWRGEG